MTEPTPNETVVLTIEDWSPEDRAMTKQADAAFAEIAAVLEKFVDLPACRRFFFEDGVTVCLDPACETHPKPAGWTDPTT